MEYREENVGAAVSLIYETVFAPNAWRGLVDRAETEAQASQALESVSLRAVMPFLEQALASGGEQLAKRGGRPSQADLLGELPIPVCIVSRDMRLMSATRKAQRLLEGESALSMADGVAHTADARLRGELRRAVAAAVDSARTSTLSGTDEQGDSQLFLVGPIVTEDGERAAVLFLNIEQGVFDRLVASLMEVHGLTRSEAEVTTHLAHGLSIDEIAEAKNLSANTVRTQVKSSFAKTGTSRQGQLVSLVLNGPALWLRLVNPGVERSPSEPGNTAQILELEDGRVLGYAEYGPADGEPVFLFHHLLGSRAEGPGDEELLERLGIRLVVPDRPGIGMSTPVAKRRLIDWPGDVLQLADHLAIPRFHALGFSTGGPHAAACAALLEGRVISLGLVASMMPVDELPQGTTSSLAQRVLTGLSRQWPSGARKLLELRYTKILENPEDGGAALERQGNSPDVELLRDPETHRRFLDIRAAAAAVPKRVFASELVSLSQPWGFRLSDVGVPVHLWHGRQDDFFAAQHAEAMSARIPDCRVSLEEGWGHFFVFREWERVLTELVGSSSRR